MKRPSRDEAGTLYADFMEEIKQRLTAAYEHQRHLRTEKDPRVRYLGAEFCYLQVRLICELVALACLCAHYNTPAANTGRILKDWNADVLLDKLAGISPKGFPHAVSLMLGPKGGPHHYAARKGQLSREELQRIYVSCGRHLHRGILKHAITGKQRVYDLDQIEKWLLAIKELLQQHAIVMPDHKAAMLVDMAGQMDRGVLIIHAEATDNEARPAGGSGAD